MPARIRSALVLMMAVLTGVGGCRGSADQAQVEVGEAVTSQRDPDNEVLARLQQKIAAAMAPFDAVALDSILATDFHSINGADQRLDKAAVFKGLRAAQGVLVKAIDDSIHIRRYGPFAIMTAREAITMRNRGQLAGGHLRLTAVWLKRGGRWQVVGGHASVIR